MSFEFSTYSLAHIAACLLSTLAAFVAFDKRKAPGGIPLFLMMLAVAEWNLVNVLEASSVLLEHKILWSKLAYLGAHTTPPLQLLFFLEYTGRTRWLTRPFRILLFVVPFLTIALAATNEWHRLIWTGFTPGPAGTNSYLYGHGPWFWVAAVYVNLMLFLGTVLMLRFTLRSREIFHRQSAALVLAILFPWLAFFLYVSGLNPYPGLDLTAIGLALSGCILVIICLRLGFLDIIPVARETLIEKMTDGVIVLDSKDRVVDLNAAARLLLGIRAEPLIGRRIDSAVPNWTDLGGDPGAGADPEKILTVQGSEPRHISLHVSPLRRGSGAAEGRLFVLRDITRLVETGRALNQANRELQRKLAEIEELQSQLREQSTRDPLTGLFNRRYLEEALRVEAARAQREGYPVGVLMIDIDQFKHLNDTHGHAAGDRVLERLGGFLRARVRLGDIACRYGGEEFLIIMPRIRIEELTARAEALRAGFEGLVLDYAEAGPRVTISIGAALFPGHAGTIEEVIHAADIAMFAAKRAGRNRVCEWQAALEAGGGR